MSTTSLSVPPAFKLSTTWSRLGRFASRTKVLIWFLSRGIVFRARVYRHRPERVTPIVEGLDTYRRPSERPLVCRIEAHQPNKSSGKGQPWRSCNMVGSLITAVDVFESYDVVFAQIAARLNLDDFQCDFADFQAGV